MKRFIVTSAVGRDRPGFVNLITSRIHELGGNVELQRATRMAEEFAAIVLFSIEGDEMKLAAAVDAMRKLPAEDMLVYARPVVGQTQTAASPGTSATLSAFGADQPGIIDEVTLLLFKRWINIESMNYDVDSAPMSGQDLFRLEATLSIPEEIDAEELRAELRELEQSLNFDILFRHPAG